MIQAATRHSLSGRARRAAVVLVLMLAGVALGGCSKCGFFWEEGNRPASCRTAPASTLSTAGIVRSIILGN